MILLEAGVAPLVSHNSWSNALVITYYFMGAFFTVVVFLFISFKWTSKKASKKK
jgi:VIT1/CCC1 family predicted Fe2+/Mn2+ transporter